MQPTSDTSETRQERRFRRVLLLAAIAGAALALLGGGASVALASGPSLVWSGPLSLDNLAGHTASAGTVTLAGVACTSSDQCTAVDYNGNEITFNPSDPAAASTYNVDAGNELLSVACVPSGQCTAVDNNGNEVTFDPSNPSDAASADIDDDNVLYGVACASNIQCTAVDWDGNEVTFNPNNAAGAAPAQIDTAANGYLNSVACPSSDDCIAVDGAGQAVTFDPADPAGASVTRIPGANTSYGVACTSSAQCVAVDVDGNAFVGSVPAPTSVGSSPSVVVAHASAASASVHGKTASVPVSCTGSSGQTCTVELQLIVKEKLKGHTLIAVTAKHHKPKITHRTVTVGSATATVAAGQTETLKVKLNATGRKLLKARHHLTAALTSPSSDVTVSTQTVTFTAPKKHKHG